MAWIGWFSNWWRFGLGSALMTWAGAGVDAGIRRHDVRGTVDKRILLVV
jgi:hypothetical protein